MPHEVFKVSVILISSSSVTIFGLSCEVIVRKEREEKDEWGWVREWEGKSDREGEREGAWERGRVREWESVRERVRVR